MTDEELIEELSEMGRHPCRAHLPMGGTLRQASARIEALTTENFKLAAGSCDVDGGKVGDEHGHFYCMLQAKVEAQAAEIEWLREVLRDIARDDFGLQGLIEDGVYEETETSRYYAARISWRRKHALAALEKQP